MKNVISKNSVILKDSIIVPVGILFCLAISMLFMTSCAAQNDSEKINGIYQNSSNAQNLNTASSDGVYYNVPVSPIDEYTNPSDADQLTIDTAQWVYNKDCLTKAGYVIKDPKPQEKNQIKPISVAEVVGVLTLNSAEKYGYKNAQLAEMEQAKNAEEAKKNDGEYYYSSEKGFVPYAEGDKEYFSVQNKCLEEYDNQETVYEGGTVSNDVNDKFGELSRQATAEAKIDSEYTTAENLWSNCMKQTGYDFLTPDKALKNKWADTTKETQAAVQDVKCKIQTNLINIWYKVLYIKQKSLIDQNLPLCEFFKNRLHKRIEFAQSIIAKY
ncbi:MAG: hypothetical protein LBT85_00245 [Bifidobacteriaceae bacterium]|jgi:hypothetical protein|nr:hypothetical protein [Bifidobacteriaceae bacterium]